MTGRGSPNPPTGGDTTAPATAAVAAFWVALLLRVLSAFVASSSAALDLCSEVLQTAKDNLGETDADRLWTVLEGLTPAFASPRAPHYNYCPRCGHRIGNGDVEGGREAAVRPDGAGNECLYAVLVGRDVGVFDLYVLFLPFTLQHTLTAISPAQWQWRSQAASPATRSRGVRPSGRPSSTTTIASPAAR